MRITELTLSAGAGGAAIAARRFHQAFREAGHDARMLVWREDNDDPSIAIFEKRPFSRALSKVVGAKLDSLGLQYLYHPASMRLPAHPWMQGIEVVHLHQAHGGYLSTRVLPQLSRQAPIVWTMHDMWAATGHCAVAAYGECSRWQQGCGHCPQLDDSPAIRFDTSALMWRLKDRLYSRSQLTVVCPSAWLTDAYRQSPLLQRFDIHHIPNGLHLDKYRPVAKTLAREALGLPSDRLIVLFGAASLSGQRKGAHLLHTALAGLPSGLKEDMLLLVVGGKYRPEALAHLGNFPIVQLGAVQNEELMVLCYAAADLFVLPSLAENLPNMLVESMACQTPCVAFSVGGCPEIIDHKVTGYLAEPRSVEDLAAGIEYLANDDERRLEMGRRGVATVRERFDIRLQAQCYLDLFQSITTA